MTQTASARAFDILTIQIERVMSFTTPLALVLLLALPAIFYIGWPRVAFRRRRDVSSLVLRSVIVALLVLALAGAQLIRSADRLAVIFLVDVSDSMSQTAKEAAFDYIRETLPSMGPDDLAGVVLFGANAVQERPLSGVRELGVIQAAPDTGNTDLAEAIRLGLGLFPAETARRLVILSDGYPTVGDTEAAAQLAAASNVEISYVPFASESAPEIQVSNVHVPSTLNAGQEFDLNLTITADVASPATITVYASGDLIHQEDVQLRAGTNNYTLGLQGSGAGFKDFRVQVDPAANDSFYQNNQLATFSRVIGPPRVLLLYVDPVEIEHLRPALEEAGLVVDALTPDQLPIGLVPLTQYDAVVMADVPATRLSQERMETLQSFVRDLGGGLVVVGGPDSYAPGGYFETPLEEMLPVSMQVRDQQRLPQLTIVYLIDRSGSMGVAGPSGVSNLELAKEAIIRSVDFLQPTDRAGIGSFDSQAYWLAEIQPVLDRQALQRFVATLRAGGGTDILAGMNLVSGVIGADPSDRKHIILLTDGGANSNGLVELAQRLKDEDGVTTSVIAIGEGAAPFLADMAAAGGGNYHTVEIIEQIPMIFTLETVLATRSYILEEPFLPQLASTSPIIEGIASAPTLLGYVATTPKVTAQTILTGPAPYNDPLLASWQYGLGRAVAFTSDAASRWASNWVTWSNFVRFWGQAVRWTITEGASEYIETRVITEGEQTRLVVDARDRDGAFLNGLDLSLSLVDPETRARLLPLRQVAPGRYETTFTPDLEGAYLLHLTGTGLVNGQEQQFDQTNGWVRSYSPEYDLDGQRGDGALLLASLADLTGGGDLTDAAAGVFAHNLGAQMATTPIWPWLLLVALLLLPFDIAVRRLIITRSDLIRLRVALLGRQIATQIPSERLSSLMGAKERGRERAESSGGVSGTVSALKSRREQARAEQITADSASQSPAGEGAAKPRFTPPSEFAPKPPDTNLAGALLKKRKDRE
ncbi:MAG: VWA domain-containing protein [Anaerolineaceae bacterium]|nr:VWA domain-containing protein [Anaerolineaceae bacterium]